MKVTVHECLIVGLATACLFEPATAAVGLLFVLSAQVADKYFTRNISDKDRQLITQLKVDVEKVVVAQQKEGLAKAFGGQR